MEFLRTMNGMHAVLLLCALIFIEEVGIPLPFLPGDLLLITAGYLAAVHRTHLSVFLILAYCSAVLGAVACYHLSAWLGRPAVLRLGGRVHLTPARLARAENWLHRAGAPAIVLARVLPGTRINASIAAGCLGMSRRSFIGGVLVSTWVWLGGFTLLGYLLGDAVTPLLPWIDRGIAVAAVLGGAIALIVWRVRRQRAGAQAAA